MMETGTADLGTQVDAVSNQVPNLPGGRRTIISVAALYILLPLWWWIGIEQFVWPIGLGLLALVLVVRERNKILLPATARWLLIFMLAQLASAAFIREPARIITFLRTLSTYVAAFLAVVVVFNSLRRREDFDRLLKVLVLLLAVCGTIGLLAILGIWRPEFDSPVGKLLPQWIRDTTYGGAVADRSVGRAAHFLGLSYFRLTGLFLFPNQYGQFIVTTVPVAYLLLRRTSRKREQGLYLLTIVIALVNLLWTTGRVPLLAFLAGGAIALGGPIVRRYLKVAIVAGSLLLVLGIALVAFSPAARVRLGQAVETALYARGAGPVDERFAVYGPTLQGFLERPVLGWGTERDIPESVFPAGSHSYYLGILYKHGMVGLLAWLGLVWALLRETRMDPLPSQAGVRVVRDWVLAAMSILSLTVVPDLDASAFAVLWLIFSLVLTAGRLTPSDDA
jgi:O-antigen ligase